MSVHLEIEKKLWSNGISAIAGVDEAGRGPLAGPVVAAAVIFPMHCFIEGVNDSKRLTELRRQELYEHICQNALAVGVGIVDHTIIDEINILRATHKAMLLAIEQLRYKPEYILVDGNSFPKISVPSQTIVDGDAISFTIAAASIIAKVTRDRIMVEYDSRYPHYGFKQHKGYGTRKHREAIARYGLCDIHRRSFCKSL